MIGTIILLSLAALVAYLVNLIVIKPIRFRNFYRKFDNVHVNPKVEIIMGNFAQFEEQTKQGTDDRHAVMFALRDKPNAELVALNYGPICVLAVSSPETLSEMIRKIPEFVDRSDMEKLGFASALPGAFSEIRTDNKLKHRRTMATTAFNLGQSKQFMVYFHEAFREIFSVVKVNEVQSIYKLIEQVNLRVVTRICYGNDSRNSKMDYMHEDGTITKDSLDLRTPNVLSVLQQEMATNPFVALTNGWSRVFSPFAATKRNQFNRKSLVATYVKIVETRSANHKDGAPVNDFLDLYMDSLKNKEMTV